MKNKHFYKLFITLSIICCLFVFNGCQQDDDAIYIEVNTDAIFNIKSITANQLPDQLGLQKALSDAKMALTNSFHKAVYDSVNGFWIDDSHINQVTSGNYESYTFGVYDPTDSLSIKNLILHKVSDSTYVPILFTYPTTPIDSLSTQIEYEILNDGLATTFYKADIIDFLDPCGWDNSDCACWRLSGNVITIETTSDDCTIYEADTDVQYQDASFTDPANDGSNGGGGANTNDPPPTDGGNTSPGDWGADINGGVSSGGNPSSGGDSPDDGSNDDSNTDTTQQDDSLQFSDGSRARVVSAPVLTIDEDAGTKSRLKAILSDPVISAEFNRLKTKIDSDASGNYKEDGAKFVFNPPATTTFRNPDAIDDFGVRYIDNILPGETVGIHIHQTYFWNRSVSPSAKVSTSPIFSDKDIDTFIANVTEARTDNPNDPDIAQQYTDIVMTSAGVFALVVDDIDDVIDANNALENDDDVYEKFYEEFAKWVLDKSGGKTEGQYIQDVVDFIKEVKVNNQNLGIDIYEAVFNTDGTIKRWKKL